MSDTPKTAKIIKKVILFNSTLTVRRCDVEFSLNGLNSIRTTQTGLSLTCHGFCRKHIDMSRWFVSATFMICVYYFPRT